MPKGYKLNRVIDGKKECRKCLQIKPIEDFNMGIKRSYVYPLAACKICMEIDRKNKLTEDIILRRRECSKQWAAKRKEAGIKKIRTQKDRDRDRIYQRRRYHNDILYMIQCRYRRRMQMAIKNRDIKNKRRSLSYLGCSTEEFIKYIESLFTNGMSWENRHLWHLDHKKPCCSFNLKDETQLNKCFHYSNIRPLWKEDNIKKIGSDIKLKNSAIIAKYHTV